MASFCVNELVPCEEGIALQLNLLSPDLAGENKQEITPIPLSKVLKSSPEIPDTEQPEQPKEQPSEGNGATENVEQNDNQEQEDLSVFVKHLIVYKGHEPCCNCFTCCTCPTCCSCCTCCPNIEIFPDTDTINEARQAGTFALLKFLVFNLLWPILREIIVYGGLGVTVGLFLYNIGMFIYTFLKDEQQIKKTFLCIKLAVSAFGLLFTIFDAGLHFRQYGFRLLKRCIAFRKNHKELDLNLDKVKPGEAKFEFFDKNVICKNVFGKGFTAFMDVARIFVLETIFYPKLLLSVFEFIMELVDNDYNPSMVSWTTWLSAVFGFLLSLFLVYVLRVLIFARVVYLIIKQIKNCEGILFLVIFVIYMYMMMLLQILMIVIIGSRFHHEYANYRAIEMSWQLWYMMISAYLLPLLGMIMFFIVHHFWTMKLPVDIIYNLLCEFQTKGEKGNKDTDKTLKELNEHLGGDKFKNDYNELNEVSKLSKFIYPYTSPFHIIAIHFYGLILLGFFICCTVNGPFGNWFWFYCIAGAFALLTNIYSASVICAWPLIIIATLVCWPCLCIYGYCGCIYYSLIDCSNGKCH